MNTAAGRNKTGFVVIELLAVVAICTVLLGLGYSVFKGARLSARVAVAENNLKQISTALELFFHKYGCYPPQGANLPAVLAPYVQDLNVFNNPLGEEPLPGRTLTDLYVEPTVALVDSPGTYVTALVTEDGTTAVVLKTCAIVERVEGASLPPDPAGIVAVLSGSKPPPTTGDTTPPPDAGDTTPPPDAGDTTPPPDAGDTTPPPPPPSDPNAGTVGGDVNINPNNNDDFEFELVKPDGTTINRDDLHASNGSLTYQGEATVIRLKPKGNGNQNTLTLNGTVYHLENKNRYILLTLPGGSMVVHLFNSKAGKGKAMGKWWIAINATGAKIEICKCLNEPCTCGLDV